MSAQRQATTANHAHPPAPAGVAPQVNMAGAQQLFSPRVCRSLSARVPAWPLLNQPLAIAPGAGQRIAFAQVQQQGHGGGGCERGELAGQRQRLAPPTQAVVAKVGRQPVKGEGAVIDLQRQAEVLGGVDIALGHQESVPRGIADGT